MRITALVLALVGCGLDPVDDLAVGQSELAACPKFGCGGDNSPIISGAYFHDLNRAGLPNDVGIRIAGFRDQWGNPYALRVSHGRISGVAGNVVISGQQLVGAQIVVTLAGARYSITIEEVITVPYWVASAAKLEAYKLSYYDWRTPLRIVPLCSNPQPESPDNLTMANGLAFYTLVFEGDRIDDLYKTVAPDSTGQWFNLGCAGSAPAKMALTGHTYAAQFDKLVTTVAERQTILKMFTADYCNDGTPYTVAGQPLTWADGNKWMQMLPDVTTLEARWTPDGAACVGVPRAAVPNTPAAAAFPTIKSAADITTLCKNTSGKDVPACDDTTLALDGFHLASANRK